MKSKVFIHIYRSLVFIVIISLVSSATLLAENVELEPVFLNLDECLSIAINNNLDLKIAKLDNWIAGTEETYTQSVYDMLLTGEGYYEEDRQERPSYLYPTERLTADYKFGIKQKLPTGTTIEIDYDCDRDWDNNIFTTINPSYTTTIDFTARQSVLKNLLGIQDRGEIKVARMNVKISDLKTYRRIEKIIADVEKKYWFVVFAKNNIAMEKRILDKALEIQKIGETHLALGYIEQRDHISNQANVKQKQINMLVAENQLKDAINSLKLVLNVEFPNPILPLDNFQIPETKPVLLNSLKIAINNRKDLAAKKQELQKKNLSLVMKENALLPEIDIVATYSANGVDRKVGKAHGTLTTTKFPRYYIGAELSYPLENNVARSEYQKAEFGKVKTINEIKLLEKTILTQVDDIVRETLLNIEKIDRSAIVRDLNKMRVAEEEKHYKNGRSSSKDLIDFQNSLLLAEIRVLLAYLDYYYSAIDLEVSKDTLLDNLGIVINENI
ncbi:MAG: TolC family protein [Candidatus Omnitrophica bacterium]|nr:TolC family protein [Candidatus Omnitrophota bacterium]